jgi:iron complex outermembrane receptor protein
MRRACCNVFVGIALACVATPPRAWAQDRPPGEADEAASEEIAVDVELELTGPARAAAPKAVEEIVVTAQKREQNVQDVPISITALTGDFLQDSGSSSLMDIGQFAPNVSLNTITDSRSTAIRIRGIGNDGVNAGIDPAVGVFLDGIYQGRTGLVTSMDLADIDRIEILRGPQGTLYGKNTAAGAINVVTKRPQVNEWGVFLENVLGNYDTREVRGSINVPMVEDKVATRVTGYWAVRDGFDELWSTGEDRNDADRNGVRVKTLFNLSDDLEMMLWGEYATDQNTCCLPDIIDYEGPPNLDVVFNNRSGRSDVGGLAQTTGRPVPPLDPFDRMVDANAASSNDSRLLSIAGELNYHVGDHVLTLLAGYRHFDFSSVLDGDFSSYNAVILTTDETFQQYSGELRLTSPVGERLEYVTGLYFYFQKDETDGQIGIGPDWIDASPFFGAAIGAIGAANDEGFISNYDSNTHKTWSYAFYGQATYSLLEDLKLTTGLRGTYEQKSRVGSQIAGFKAIDAGPFGPDRFADEDFDVFNLSPMGVMQWFPTMDTMVFGKVALGFKSGGYNQLRTLGGANTQFDDEEATDVELGFRSTWFDRMVTLNTTLFHTWYDNFQATIFDGSAFYVTNAGSLRSYGVETDMLVVPHPSLMLGVGVGYNPTVYDEFDDAPCTADQIWRAKGRDPLALSWTCAQDLEGEPVNDAPEWSATVFAQYTRALGTMPALDRPVLGFLRADYTYQDSIYLQQDLDRNLRQPAYNLLNLRTGIKTEDERWEVAFSVRNVTDEGYNVAGFDAPIMSGYVGINGAPRQYLGTIRFRY